MQKQRLDFEFTIDFRLIGIASQLQEYKVAHHLNVALHLNFKRIEDWEVAYPKKKEIQYFKQYYFKDLLSKQVFYLIKNKTDSFICLPEFSILDYFFILFGDLSIDIYNDFYQKINQLQMVSSAIKIQPDKIKNIENILIDEEIF